MMSTSQGAQRPQLAPDVCAELQRIGAALDEGRSLRVLNAGFVTIDRSSEFLPEPMETENERQGTRRPAAGARQGPARRQGAPRGSRTPGAAARLSRDGLAAAYHAQLTGLRSAYPMLEVLHDDEGMWLRVQSAVLAGLPQPATFLIGVPFRPGLDPKAWGFWGGGAGEALRWIGPRHTNFDDGTICAFAPHDGVWTEGGDLTTLIDVYSVWALRHLHLATLGRWPGRQYALAGADPRAQAFYRLRECQDAELCGCGSATTTYGTCCKPRDTRWPFGEAANAFLKAAPGGFTSRQAPDAVTNFLSGALAPPRLRDVHMQLRHLPT